MYTHLPILPGDPILSLHEAFLQERNPKRANLSIGLYFDDEGRLPVLPSVRVAAERIAAKGLASSYLPIEGAPDYRLRTQELVFGQDHEAVKAGRIATMQAIGGSGAIHVAARLITTCFPGSDIWLSDPTWDNHAALCASAGLRIHRYPYYDPASNGLRLDAMLDALSVIPPRSVVLMQPCCHNPTGIDPTRAQWAQIIEVLRKRDAIPFLDMAYQGFGAGIEDDAWAIRAMVDAGLMPIVTNSFSKNFSLYGERVGALSVVCPTPEQAQRVLGQAKAIVRSIYSSPALRGSQLVGEVLGDDALRAQWLLEVTVMRERIHTMRHTLAQRLVEQLPGIDVRYLTEQRGMFSYTGLAQSEVDELREVHGVYLVRSGRMCVAGLGQANVGFVADALAGVLAKRGGRA